MNQAFCFLSFVVWLSALSGQAQETNLITAPGDLKKMTLEQLLALKVTTVSRQEEPASRAAAAIDVITNEEIERSGATTVPDALRLATGVQVSRFSGNSFAVGTRGFTSLAANKLQVMQDGRSLYSPLFSGVFWDAYDILLDNVDRIEVVRGPGATMWGANAVNGVINVITKDAKETQGTYFQAGGGTEERGFGSVRYGDKLGQDTYFRVYGQYWSRDAMATPDGGSAHNGTQDALGGFRIDSDVSDQNHLTVNGDYLYNDAELMKDALGINRDGSLRARWSHQFDADSELQVQTYYDRFERNIPGQFGEKRNTYDIDGQYRFTLGDRNTLISGMEYRVSGDTTEPGGTIQFSPSGATTHIFSFFLQDDIALVPDKLGLVLGSKFEYDSLDGFEPQPTIRLAWTPTKEQTLWAAFSRPVRMPSRIDDDLRFVPVPATGFVTIRGNPDFRPEEEYAYELGYRIQPHRRVALDVATYYDRYEGLRSLEPTLPTVLPLVQKNLLDGEAYGVELSIKYQATSWWRLSANYSYLHEVLLPRSSSRDPTRGTLEGNDAPNLFSLWSSMDLPHRITVDAILRYVDRLPNPNVPSYTTMDARIAWRPKPNLELAVVGQNLFQPRHREWGSDSPTAAEVQRGVYGKVTWRF